MANQDKNNQSRPTGNTSQEKSRPTEGNQKKEQHQQKNDWQSQTNQGVNRSGGQSTSDTE